MAKSHDQVTTNVPDQATQGRQQAIWDAFQKASTGYQPLGANPASLQALQGFQGLSGLGSLGASALGGNQAAFSNFMNPYQQNVIDASNNQYGIARQGTINSINDQATRAGAFGGTRADIAQGQALGDLASQQGSQMANLTYGGFNDAMSRANQAANLGMGANQNMASLGDYLRQIQMAQANPALGQAQILGQGMTGPTGNTQTTQMQQNPFGMMLGGAGVGASLPGPAAVPGAIIGGGLGLLGGLFG